ncbi:uncharacterized protein LOC103316733 [Nasonia vitripennis]|uniref:Uncharacterized protein n=1 Tax=Nasonia vitripennis TaxID=7425 RepID=A0A7M7H966_NASVI|nr:uncharacterized protein LOC103316733 [Nasonia vitripennis]XP_008210241.1 uncharacterized protein LOC103316733 [Nasonia vitripennis]XP_008210242.1 uncharacterized protein LOC103316733 [Nasonia vitripennis]XP_016843969.1 uncharacterized protein LOC103316733 [Nasonia vitripennis]XP_031778246.1 uncharacterized protein LOC103316733 [Nasonia vitripennis]XP_032457342.1 uncharacterized protein LOC103316733 [Nasonia vitripennis]XP_032457343.1 uncharacterized protein LOC103316733 [Nasonia vitripenni
MNPNKLKFLTERYDKENRNLKFQEKFIALPGLKPVSGKFYAKHDALSSHDSSPVEYIDLVKRSASATPKDNFHFPPPAVNMEYGWFAKPLIPRPSDKRLIFPIKQSDFIKTEIYIREMQKNLPEMKFTGIPFRT